MKMVKYGKRKCESDDVVMNEGGEDEEMVDGELY